MIHFLKAPRRADTLVLTKKSRGLKVRKIGLLFHIRFENVVVSTWTRSAEYEKWNAPT